MKTVIALSLALAGGHAAVAQAAPSEISRSASGQFLVTSQAGDLRRVPTELATNVALLRLEPTFTAVSAERIKQAICRLIDGSESWEQPITISLRRARSVYDPATVAAGYLGPRRAYNIRLPAVVAPDRYMRTITEAVLLEISGRSAGEGNADIPTWLVEGMTYHLLCNNATELLLSAPSTIDNGPTFNQARLPLNRTQVEFLQFSPLEKAHRQLVGVTPLSFEELSWPLPNQLEGDGRGLYQASAQVFMFSLLKLPDGPACLRKFLASLPACQNWQMAFLAAFEPHFKRPLDIEKWWALESFSFATRDLTRTWPLAESWDKLNVVLTENVNVYVSTNSLPERSQLTLAQMIQTWNANQQDEALARKRVELRALSLRIAPELYPLTSEYISALSDYLTFGDAGAARNGAGRIGANSARFAELKLLKRLSALEKERARLRPESMSPSAGPREETAAALREMRLPASTLRAN